MLNITVKTLDSQSRDFSVEDDITVRAFKDKIASSVNIPVERQRLIFQGRVLQDNSQLNARGDINNKVIHLVERLPTPAQPTPAEQARTQQRQQQTTNQANAQPRQNAPPTGNILGPFPMPGPDSNYGQLVQQMIQQALTGMGNAAGPTMIRSTVRHPNAPGGGASTEIQIQISPQGASTQNAGSSQTGPQTSQQQPQSGANQQPTPVRTAGPPAPRSEPRRQLQNVERLLSRLEDNIVALETKNYDKAAQSQADDSSTGEEAPETEGAGTSDEPMQVQEGGDAESTSEETVTASAAPVSASGPSTPGVRHPSLPEIGAVLRRFHGLETRFLPFLMEYTEFLENDPAFSSTESPEYKAVLGFLTAVLNTQRALSHIQRILSMFAIPLSETPPRRMLMQGPCPTHRGQPPHSRRINQIVSAGPYQPLLRVRHHPPAPPQGPYQRVPFVFHPIGPGGNMRPSIVPVSAGIIGFAPGPGQPPLFRPHQSGLYGHPATPVTTTTASPQLPTTTQSSHPPAQPSATIVLNSEPRPPTLLLSERGTLNPSSDAPVDPDADPMTIHVSTHIHPRINITIYADCLPPGGRPDRIPLFGVTGRVEADEQGNILPMELEMSDIPGVPEVGIREMENHIRDNVLRALNAMNLIPRQLQHQQEEMQRSQSERQSANQTENVNVARLIGQNVHSAVMNHMQGRSTASSTTPSTTQTTTSSSTRQTSMPRQVPHQVTVISNAPVQTQATTSSTGTGPTTTVTPATSATTTTTPTTPAPSAFDANTRNMLTDLMNQITGGNFGNTESAAAASRSSNTRILGYAGRDNKRIPMIRRTPNCVNDIVRGQGYPEEMMQLTGHGNILSLVLFLAGELLTIPDCLSFMAGATEPIDRLSEPLRTAISDCWYDGQIPTRDQIEEEVDRHSEEARDSMRTYFSGQRAKSPDIDVVESNLSLYRYVLRKTLHLLYLGNFSRDILQHLMDSFNLVIHLNTHILHGTEEAVTDLVLRNLGTALDPFSLPTVSDQSDDPMLASMRTLLSANLIPFARSNPVSQDQIDQFVMNVSTPEEPEPSQESAASTPNTAPPGPAEPAPLAAPAPSSGGKQEEEEESRGPVVEHVAMDTGPADETIGAAGGEPDWRTLVPAEWVSIIESDIEKQKSLPEQPPYSDAYLAGTPASKRRKV